MSIKVFISYASADQELRKKLEEHLGPLEDSGEIMIWQDQKILPGAERWNQITTHLNEADLILLLVSPAFLASDAYKLETPRAMQRQEAGGGHVVPVILHPCDWSRTPFAGLQCLPRNQEPIALWKNQDQAWQGVIEGISQVLREQPPPRPPEPPPPMGRPQLDDSLSSDNGQWFVGSSQDGGSCTFRANKYYVETWNRDCLFYKGLHEYFFVKDFLLQVQMKIIKGNEGGLIFRWHQAEKADEFYYFYITTGGFYGLIRGEYTKLQDAHKVIDGSGSEAINKGVDQENLIAVKASGSTLELFANGKLLSDFSQAIPDTGQFGLVSGRYPSVVAFSQAKMWRLGRKNPL